MTTDQALDLLALLHRIAVALEKQNEVTSDLVSITCGVSNRIEELGGCIPSIPDSLWKGRK